MGAGRALAAALRYQARFFGFAFMLTSAYPSGLYGDPVPAGMPAALGSWWLFLTSRAKALVTAFIVLGALFAVAEAGLEAVNAGHAVTAARASNQLQADVGPLNSTLSNYPAQVQACQTNSCVTISNDLVAAAYYVFAQQVRAIPMPSAQASAEAANLAAAASHAGHAFDGLAGAATQGQDISIGSGLRQAIDQVQQDYSTLAGELAGS